MECLKNLREIGFQTGCGLMVGSPYQTAEAIVKDLRFMKEFNPHMVGIGPFLSHKAVSYTHLADTGEREDRGKGIRLSAGMPGCHDYEPPSRTDPSGRTAAVEGTDAGTGRGSGEEGRCGGAD